MTTTTSTPYGGYALRGYREAGGQDGVAFDAIVTHYGRPVLHVYNAGEGGCCTYHPATRGTDHAAHRDALRAFEDFATHWNADSPYAGQEDADALVYRLLEVHWLNSRRNTVFLIDDESYWQDGQARGLRATSHDEAAAYLTATYPGRNARIWDRTVSEFVRVD